MIAAQPVDTQRHETKFRPQYSEIASQPIQEHYKLIDKTIVCSRLGSDYVRRTMAELEALRLLQKVSNVEDDWDSFGSPRPTDEAARSAEVFIKEFISKGLFPDGILPSAEGGIAICFIQGSKYADVEIMNSGEILAVKYTGDERPIVWSVGPTEKRESDTAELFADHLVNS